MSELCVGILGSGAMGDRHARTWRALGAQLLIYSPRPERRRRLADAVGARAVDDPAELVRAADLVDVCTPTDQHRPAVRLAAAAGRSVVCEKPLARTAGEAAALVTELAAAGARLFPAHVLRYFPAHAAAAGRARRGELGRLRTLRLHREAPRPEPSSWLHDERRSGGVLLDLMIHDLDFARWVAGEVVGLRARRLDRAGRSGVRVWLSHASGVRSEVTAVWGEVLHDRACITGAAGRCVVSATDRPDRDAQVQRAFAAQLGDVAAALAHRTPTRVTPADAVAAVRLASFAEYAGHTGGVADLTRHRPADA